MNIEKRSDETALQYHKRLVYGKLVDHTLADTDYSELAELAYGQQYSSDSARKMFYGSKRTLELLEAEQRSQVQDADALSELDRKTLELKKEQQKFYDQRREYSKLVTSEARNEHLYDALVQAAMNLNTSVGDMYGGVVHTDMEFSDNEAVLVFSDWHYGLKTSNVFNEFNIEICKERVEHVVDEVVARLQLHSCWHLHIVILGDMIHGAIHTSARVASEELVCDQMMQVSEILAQSIEYLSHYVDETFVYATYGNHARTVQKKNDNIHRDNMERLISWWLTQRLSGNEQITVVPEETNEFIFINASGHEMCAVHGDNDSVNTAPRLLTTLFQKQYGKNIEYILLGDKHHRESFDELGVTAMLCGSLCGTDDYANNKRMFSEPSQLLLITNPKHGVDAEYRIKCK